MESKNDNMNINVQKKRKNSIVPTLLVIIIILIGIIGMLLSEKMENSTNTENVVNKAEIENKADENLIEDEKQEEVQQEVLPYEKVYSEIEGASWISKNPITKINIYYIEDGKVMYKNGPLGPYHIDLEYGKAKYVYNHILGGSLEYVYVVSEDGNAYKITGKDLAMLEEDDIENLKIEKNMYSSKVMDILYNFENSKDKEVYYLTEDGKLYNCIDNKLFE